MPVPEIILSAFADEAANHKTALEQFSALASVGLQYYSPRFVDVRSDGNIQHVVDLNKTDTNALKKLHAEFGMHVTSIGSRVGKVKLLDVKDGSHNTFVPFRKYLSSEVTRTIKQAVALDTKLIRGFSFYHPQTDPPKDYVDQAVDQLGQIVDLCAKEGVVYGLEVEANLIGQDGHLLAELSKKVNSPNMVCIFDGGNLVSQNMTPGECYEEYLAMKKHIGWIHIKDYRAKRGARRGGPVDEDALKNFVPSNIGDSLHEHILRDFRSEIPKAQRKMKKLGVPGVFLELEPHLKGGGQFGGFSGPDGMGVAARALCSLLDYVDIDYHLRTFDDVCEARGF